MTIAMSVMTVDGIQLHCNLNKTEAHMRGECQQWLACCVFKHPECTSTKCQQQENRTIRTSIAQGCCSKCRLPTPWLHPAPRGTRHRGMRQAVGATKQGHEWVMHCPVVQQTSHHRFTVLVGWKSNTEEKRDEKQAALQPAGPTER